MNNSEVYYDNFLRAGTVTLAGESEPSGFESNNAYDWRDFSLFYAQGTVTLTVTLTKALSIDALIIYCQDVTGALIEFQDNNPPASPNYTTRASIDLTAATNFTGIKMAKTAATLAFPIGRKLRIKITAASPNYGYFRQLFAGPALAFPIGQYQGVKPPTLLQSIVSENVISINGSIIGKNYKRVERSAEIALDHLSPAWVRASWEPFALHMARRACFYVWAPVLYPDEVVFAATDAINPPENSGPSDFMSVNMTLRCLV